MNRVAVRRAAIGDVTAIAAVAVAAGQTGEWSGADPAYVRHLLGQGQVVVAESAGTVTGFGASRPVPTAAGEATMLCDLFVDPRFHGRGAGQAMLGSLWTAGTARLTFSSLHAHALPLYTRAGLDAWWPLLYLSGEVAALAVPAGWAVTVTGPGEVAGWERLWTGRGRAADHQAWAARPGGRPAVAAYAGQPMAAGTVAGAGEEYGIVHLATAPQASAAQAAEAVLAVLASLDPPDGRARVCLPGPHPAVRPLLAARWRNDYTDLFMATQPGLLDPRRAVPSPAEA
jgi:GNAT superfamily N-acetyltransferase